MTYRRFDCSVVSYPRRGIGGNHAWRGNSGPGIVAQFLLTWHVDRKGDLDTKSLVCDPMKGSDTTGDVCKQLGVPYRGFDLHEGFDAARDDLLAALDGQRAKSIFVHPPYYGMLKYSGRQWGDQPHPADLSQFGIDVDSFDEMLQAVIQNIACAVQPGGHYGILVGSWRKEGRFYHMPSRVVALAPDDLAMEVIKVQQRTSSEECPYPGRFVAIAHESLLVFRRGADDSVFAISFSALERFKKLQSMTWRNVVLSAMRSGEVTSPRELEELLANHPKAAGTNTLGAKLRQTLRRYPEAFANVARGKYAPITGAA